MPSRKVFGGVKFGRFWTFDRGPPSWILRKITNSPVGLFSGWKTMSMSIFVQIGWTGFNCQAKMWSPSRGSPASASLRDRVVHNHRALLWELKIAFYKHSLPASKLNKKTDHLNIGDYDIKMAEEMDKMITAWCIRHQSHKCQNAGGIQIRGVCQNYKKNRKGPPSSYLEWTFFLKNIWFGQLFNMCNYYK